MASVTLNNLSISRSTLLSLVLAIAMMTSSVVFSEPAPVDVLMAGFIVAICIIGGGRIGLVTTTNLMMWLPIVALSFVATSFSPDFKTALIHQIVTLFLVLGAVAIAAFVAADPEPRTRLVLNCYVVGIAIACLLGYIGYFKLLPGSYDLFTVYGRARGSFKDPNVFGAAIGPAMTYLCWLLLRQPIRYSMVPAALCLFMAPALLLSFSRGAWISLAVSLLVLAFIALTRTRRNADRMRMGTFAVVGCLAVTVTLAAVLQISQVSNLLRERASLTQGYDEGPEGRFGGQRKGMRLIIENPMGIGTHTFRTIHHHEEVHNVYLTMFHNAGWIGGLLFIGTMFMTFFQGLYGALRLGALQCGLAVATASMAGLIVEGLVIDLDHWRHLFIVMGLVWGLCDAQRLTDGGGRRWYDRSIGSSITGRAR
jgi:O-antigen ligase